MNAKHIIDHTDPRYIAKREESGDGKWNGCYYYSKEIVDNIIPNVKTDRPWNTLGTECTGCVDHAIVFLHNNATPWKYKWLKEYKDLILIGSNKYTLDACEPYGHTIFIPLSVDIKYVEKFKTTKTKDVCYAGNRWNFKKNTNRNFDIPNDIDVLEKMSREQLLTKLAQYERVYCIGRTAIEAQILGCKVLPCDNRFPDPYDSFKVIDNLDAAKMIQDELDKYELKRKEEQLHWRE